MVPIILFAVIIFNHTISLSIDKEQRLVALEPCQCTGAGKQILGSLVGRVSLMFLATALPQSGYGCSRAERRAEIILNKTAV